MDNRHYRTERRLTRSAYAGYLPKERFVGQLPTNLKFLNSRVLVGKERRCLNAPCSVLCTLTELNVSKYKSVIDYFFLYICGYFGLFRNYTNEYPANEFTISMHCAMKKEHPFYYLESQSFFVVC